MRKLLRIVINRFFSGHKHPPEEAIVDMPNMDKRIVKDAKKLEEQEARAKRQQNELAETQATIRFLRAQLNTLGGGNHKRELD